VKQAVGNYYFYLYASDFGINIGNIFSVKAEVGNSCGFSTSSALFKLYKPTPCECGIGAGCNQLPKMANNIKEKINLFKIYPNPSNDIINIDIDNLELNNLNSTLSTATVYNMFGKLVERIKITNNKAVIDVKGYTKGIYILKINTDGTEENHQFIVK
jgi:hypothetical protein